MATCYVCNQPIEPDGRGRIRIEGITPLGDRRAWGWGPVPVHEPCRLDLVTPLDDRIGVDMVATWDRVPEGEIR